MTREEKIALARRWVNEPLTALFEAEIANEVNGGVSPATVSSAIDSISQGLTIEGDDTASEAQSLVSLLVIRDLVAGRTPLRDLL